MPTGCTSAGPGGQGCTTPGCGCAKRYAAFGATIFSCISSQSGYAWSAPPAATRPQDGAWPLREDPPDGGERSQAPVTRRWLTALRTRNWRWGCCCLQGHRVRTSVGRSVVPGCHLRPGTFSPAAGNPSALNVFTRRTSSLSRDSLRIRDGTELARSGGRTMPGTATLLIVTILAGGPVGSLGCEVWCTSPVAAGHHRSVGCHAASRTMPPGPQIASTAGCHDAAAMTPFVTEARQTESAPVAASAVALFDSSAIGPDNDETTAGWCVFNVQPPRPPSSRAVLRV